MRGQVFVGVDPDTGHPRLIARQVLYDHAYILGATGSGKTSCGMIPLLEQLALPVDGRGESLGEAPPHPVLVVDLKEVPDAGLKAAADRVAQSRSQGPHALLYCADEGIESLPWDPLSVARLLRGVNQQAGFLLNSLGLVYDPVYGEEYFANAMRTALHAVLMQKSIEDLTFDDLVELVGELITTKTKRKPNLFKGNEAVATSWRDARGLYDKIQTLRHLDKLVTDTTDSSPNTLNLQELIQEGRVLYVHLGSTFMPQECWDIARMLVFSLVKLATDSNFSDRWRLGDKRRCFIFADEFQRMGVKNIVQRFEDARALGITFVLAHQSPKSLTKKDGELFEQIFQNTGYRQAFTVEDLELLERLQRFSGLKSQYLSTETATTGRQKGASTTKTHAETTSYGETVNGLGFASTGWRAGSSDALAQGVSASAKSDRSFGIREEKVPRYDDEANHWVNKGFLRSVIYTRDGGRGSLTPTGAEPVRTLGMFHSPQESRSLAELGFVLAPRIPVEPVEKAPALPAPVHERPVDKRAVDQMKARMDAARKALADQLPQPRVLETFARANRVSTDRVQMICVELGIPLLDGKQTVLSVAALNRLQDRLAR
ncbi:MAG: hypothetical protein CMJ58_28690 [Planctomycetaceae bacterium]|nr:hypothetical protein [Planctomycetaceae bacterium]